MERLAVGVIGLGMGSNHVKAFQEHPGAEVVAICDPLEDRLARVGDQHFVKARFKSAEEMLAARRFDIVSIATPNAFHKPLAVAALEAGAHVLCEKPMAMNTDEGRAMIDAARRHERRLMINFSYRFTEQSWALKEAVDAGVLGDVYFGRTIWHRRRGLPGFGGWFGQKALAGGGPLIDLGVHRLDLALWLMGYPKPVWVLGSTYNPIGADLARRQGKAFDVEDLAVGLIKFANGATLEVEASWAANIGEAELMETRLLGTKAGLLQRNTGGTYAFEAFLYEERAGGHFDARLSRPSGVVPTPMGYLVDRILDGGPHMATGEEGLLVMTLLDAIYASARTGAPVKI